jgi:lipopolysaccharide/colanic/teichoic acid biosynthesis glycosyltransferase
MPTNYQAQVKMTPKTKANRVARDSVALAPGLSNDAVAKSVSSARLRGAQPFREYSAPELKEATNESAKSPPTQQARITRTETYGSVLLKRVFDLALGTLLFVIALPIVLVAAVAIRVNTPGSPFFFQTRLGKNGKPFRIFKLRGMYIDAPVRFASYYDYSAKRDLEFCFHHEEDPRVTRAGRFIRKTSIDELPNLWNVILGDMSLVGPRPEIPEVLALYGPHRDEYLSVKPGVTCLSKCTGRDRLTKRETIEFDLDYIRRRSFSFDLQILWRTFRGVVLRRDVF